MKKMLLSSGLLFLAVFAKAQQQTFTFTNTTCTSLRFVVYGDRLSSCGTPYHTSQYTLPIGPPYTYDVVPGSGTLLNWVVGPTNPDDVHITRIIFYDPTLTYFGVIGDPACGNAPDCHFTTPGCEVTIEGQFGENGYANAN